MTFRIIYVAVVLLGKPGRAPVEHMGPGRALFDWRLAIRPTTHQRFYKPRVPAAQGDETRSLGPFRDSQRRVTPQSGDLCARTSVSRHCDLVIGVT